MRSRMKQRTAIAALLLISLNIACSMHTVEGIVVDEQGATIPSCMVVLEVGTNGGMQQARHTDEAGKFYFGQLATFGGCALRFEKEGFETRRLECPSAPLRVVLKASSMKTSQ
jgi:hypothetical protein